MNVLKFGGTSVGTASSLRAVKEIVLSHEVPPVVVVSALGGLTDRLIATANMAASRDRAYEAEISAMLNRHLDIIRELVPAQSQGHVSHEIKDLAAELEQIYKGVYLIGDLPARTLDVIVSYGERMSSRLVAAIIPSAVRMDSLQFVKTEKWLNRNIADQPLTTRLIKEKLSGLECPVIVPGFISTDRDTGEITNLGRGGSDFTAALIAAALDAEVLDIWTDVDGFMTADPRIVPNARIVPHMTFVESMELCTFGAKVIYPPTIYPVFHKNIPIRILNTFNPTAPGTLITESRHEGDPDLKGVTVLKGTTVFTITGQAVANAGKFGKRAFNALSRKGLSVNPLVLSNHRAGIALAVADTDADAAHQVLMEEFAPETGLTPVLSLNRTGGLATIAIVGDNMSRKSHLKNRILNLLSTGNVELLACSDGVSDTTFTVVTPLEDAQNVLASLHDSLFTIP